MKKTARAAAWLSGLVWLFTLPPAAAAAPEHPLPAAAHAGAVRVGERFDALTARALWRNNPDISLDTCQYYSEGLLPPGVAMMVVNGTVVRFDLSGTDTPGGVGPFGLRIGDDERATRRKLPPGPVRVEQGLASGIRRIRWHDPASPGDLAVQADLDPAGKVDHLSWGRRRDVINTSACL